MNSPVPPPSDSQLPKGAAAILELMNHLDDIQCWIKDRKGAFVWVNQCLQRWCSTEGHPEGIIGKTDYDLFPKEIADRFRADDEKVLAGKPVINRVEPVVGPDHLTSWNVTTKLPYYDEQGEVAGTVGITRPKDEKAPAQISSGLLKVMSHIREHFKEPLEKTHLAELLGIGVSELEALFQKELQMTPQQYLRRVRVRLACRDLVDSHLGYEEIASKYGFFDQGDFFAQFLAETGENPRVYRSNLEQRGVLRS
ncbi:MAG: HTH-type transcriptional activator RhaS [Verrucomicrobiota bacterium]|jgi:AraC-like DNA-binding protein